ncbi:MAG TPA: hypothetical protein VHZ07_16840 [Bryobacteraceae bacterium]|nr:hypothetical protein [Bryobacteraceae bacterium]
MFAALAVALILQIPFHRPASLNSWRMAAKPTAIAAVVRSLRPVYPYSVIPGGVYSAKELERARSTNRLLHEHYADFNLAETHLVTTAEARYAYVSYRQGGKLLWTTHKLLIPKGETLLTDGVNFCRTRCGNRLSETPHRETLGGNEPPDSILSLPNFTPSLLANDLVGLNLPTVASAAAVLPIAEARLQPVVPSSAASGAAAYESPLPPSRWLPVSLIGIPLPAIYAPQANPKLAALTPSSPTDDTTSFSDVPEPRSLDLALLALLGVYGFVTLRRKRCPRVN